MDDKQPVFIFIIWMFMLFGYTGGYATSQEDESPIPFIVLALIMMIGSILFMCFN